MGKQEKTIRLFQEAISATAKANKKQGDLYSYLYKLVDDEYIEYDKYEQVEDAIQSYLAEEISDQTMFPCKYSFDDICGMIREMYK